MKVLGNYIQRNFYYDGKSFYTTSFFNPILNEEIFVHTQNEFIIYFVDGEILNSSEMNVEIKKQSENLLVVNFSKDNLSVEVNYFIENNVINKKLIVFNCCKCINYIDCDTFEFEDTNNIYYPKKQNNIKEMGNFNGYYVELGQPIYAKSLFMGMEFPMGENRIQERKYFSRYYYGKSVEKRLDIHSVIIGAAPEKSKEKIQASFFDYIKAISLPASFRKQYNSWYDHMLNITNDSIIKSFLEINKGFKNYGITLDAFVVDDGWANYESVWKFNDKFPNELKDISECVKNLGSTLGLWIGPRGGYNGTQVTMSDWLEKNKDLNIGSKNKISNDVNVGDFNYLRKMKEKMLEYQSKYDISYWKIDGMLLKPDTEDESGPYGMHTMTAVYEFMISLFNELREERGEKSFWINLTSYVNPSPWFLQWVNSLWIQTSQDVGFTPNGGNDIQQMITYRDSQYYEFLIERDIQLPLCSLYNHEPIYAESASMWYLDHQIYCSIEEFKEYLMFIATRGNAFWEFYYSYSMFDDERWEVNAKAIKWIEENYPILKNSTFFGTKPSLMGVYGYYCQSDSGSQSIISFRNPSDEIKSYKLENIEPKEYEVVLGNKNYKVFEDGSVEVKLNPKEIIILKSK